MAALKASRVRRKKSKGNKWKKGQSSSSNPSTNKHRTQAKNRFFNYTPDGGDLTEEALAKHDEALSEKESSRMEEDSDNGSHAGTKTFNTWATNWTDCTNKTFSKVHRYWTSNSALHKEILAVLAALTEVIKLNGGKETETEYFGALMTSMESVDTESLPAVVYLLHIVMRRMPVAVLRNKFSQVSKVLHSKLTENAESASTSLLKHLVSCMGFILKVQDAGSWADSSTIHMYNTLLAFLQHSKPKVRKQVHKCVCDILRGDNFMSLPNAPPYHPAATATAKFCIQNIEDSGGGNAATTTLHILELLKDVTGAFPHNSLKSACEAILRLMTLSSVLIKGKSMQALHGMFAMQPTSKCLPADLNAQIITALYDFQPGESDVQPTVAWITVMEKAHMNLNRLDDKLGISHMPRLFTTCMGCLLSQKKEICQAVAGTLKTLLKDCVTVSVAKLQPLLTKTYSSPILKMFKAVEGGLSYQYYSCWDSVLQVLAVFYEAAGKEYSDIMKKSLQLMADLRESHNFTFKVDLDLAFGTAIKVMGPEWVIECVPLQITGDRDDYNFPRSWMLPVLKDHIQATNMAYFAAYFLPLAELLKKKSLELSAQTVVCKAYETLHMQIWALLPSFCNKPTDILKSFKDIARSLGSALTSRSDLRMVVMASLRRLILQNIEQDEIRKEVAKFAKNFLPIMFNLFTTEPENERDPTRLAALETIKIYMQITDTELVLSMFDKILDKISEDDIVKFRRYALFDLVIASVPYMDAERLNKVVTLVIPNLESTDRTMQKKSYRILQDVCAGTSKPCKKFVSKNIQLLQTVLLQSLSSSGPSSKAPRLQCLIQIFRQLDTNETEFLVACVPEAILCTKEINEKARSAAYGLLIEMADALHRWRNSEDAIDEYFEMILAGLAGSPHMVNATVLALSRLVQQYKEKMSSSLIGLLVENVCILVKSKSREIVQAALTLLKVILIAFKDVTLASFLKDLVSSLVTMKEDNRHHFRFKAKEIFAKLIRKFGYQTIYGMCPESHSKMLVNIRKTQERVKRKKKQMDEIDEEEGDTDAISMRALPESIDEILKDTDSESEDGNKKANTKGKKTQKRKGQAWLKEGAGEIVDFMDSAVANKVTATKPEENLEDKKIKHDFKTTSDGRLLITEDSEKKITKKTGKESKEIDDLDELLQAMSGPNKKAKKRNLEDGDNDDVIPEKYQAGGSGIHRPISKAKKVLGDEYKAKKAGGDIKRKGKPDPYAYVPLQLQNLNKRKRAKVAGQFKNIVKSAKRGAVKGSRRGKAKKV